VTRVLSAHHGTCPLASNAFYAQRAARVFASPVSYELYHCIAQTQARLLHSRCGGAPARENTAFITLAHPERVTFAQDGYTQTVFVSTFGIAAHDKGRSMTLYMPVAIFPKPPPPPHTRVPRYRGPALFAGFYLDGDPFGIGRGECPQ
jgi:hypothetical protein